MNENLLLLTDSYKYSHWAQYPPGTEIVHSYLEARVGARFPETVFFGLQYLLKRYFEGEVLSEAKIEEAEAYTSAHLGPGVFPSRLWRNLLAAHGGHLPLRIHAVREGIPVPVGNVLLTIENTDPRFPWLTNFVETILVQLWYPCTVATLSREAKKILLDAAERSGIDDPKEREGIVQFQLHDFGCRGVSSMESAAIGGVAHLINFRGTDTVPALRFVNEFYEPAFAGRDPFMPAFSVPAAEHSTITTWGEDREADAFAKILDTFPTGIVSIVADSYDVFRAAGYFAGPLKDRVLERAKTGGRLVIRPDSGDPVEVNLRLINELAKAFGYDERKWSNSGSPRCRVLPPFLRILQGDGMNLDTLKTFLDAAWKDGWSSENWVFGMGGGLLQQVNRDTQRFALKASAVRIAGEWKDVQKRPATDPSKASKAGRLWLVDRPDGQGYRTIRDSEKEAAIYLIPEVFGPVFENGKIVCEDDFEIVRARAAIL